MLPWFVMCRFILLLFIVSLCVCVRIHMLVCVHMYVAGVCTCVGVYDQQVSPSVSLHWFFESGSFMTLELSSLSRLAS